VSLATSYAKALYQAAKEGGTSSEQMMQIEKQMDEFQALLSSSKDLSKALLGPVIALKDKIAIIDAIAQKGGFSTILQRFLVLLAQKERLPGFSDIRDAFSSERLEADGGIAGKVISADPLAETDVKSLADAFSKKLGKKVAFRVSTDPSLLAGMQVNINGVTYDGSLKSKLKKLRDAVVVGADIR
jgi:F-type H+-transporting ATPase subunit delta